jgi:hypothetical protein
MAGVDFSQPILGAGASAKTDFAAAQARTGLNLIVNGRFKRGINAELGIEAFANASAELSKFVRASIEGTAFARAQAGIQLQLPLNLFDEFGFSVKAEAIAEAAAGVEVALGLSIGDFVLLAKRDPNLIGLPLEILLLFLEEVSIGGSFEINVSAAAKAHASVSVSGTIIEKAGDKAGFYYTVDAGVGLAAGVGMGLKAGAEFKDFRRFFGRTVDKTVDTTIQEILKQIPSNLKLNTNPNGLNPNDPNLNLKPWIEAFSPIAKTALRIAYDIGLKISENNPGHSQNDAAVLCDEAIKTFLEESQRFILNKLLESGIDSIRKLLEQQVPNLPLGSWDAAIQERTDLAVQLLKMPAEPFQDSSDNFTYWETLIEKSIDLVVAIGNPDPEITKSISIIYCTTELLLEAMRAKINSTSAYAVAIGAGNVNSDTQPFNGQILNQPSHTIIDAIRNIIGGNGALSYPDLLQFLVDDIIVNNLLASFPELNQFMNMFRNDFGKAENEILKLLLQNVNSFDVSNPNSTQVDPKTLLTLIVNSIDKFLTEKFKSDILPQILNNVSDPNLKLYIEEVLYASVVYMKDVGLKSLLNWENESFDNDDFTEALAGVIMLLLGRTVVIVADTFITATQEQVQNSCNEVSDMIRNKHGDIHEIISKIDPDLIDLTADCMKIGGVVLGPLKDDTRKRVRNILYQVFETIPPGKEQDFLSSLGDDFFIPNVNQLQKITNELATISKDRFNQFVEQFILRTGEYILEKLEDLLLAIIDLIVNWEKHLAETLLAVANFLRNLEDTIRALNRQLINVLTTATDALHNLFETLGSSTLKNRIKNDIKVNFVSKALDALEDNDVYNALPSDWRRDIRLLTDDAVDALIDNPFTQPIFNSISAIANQLDDLLPDVRELDPNDNLPEQIMLLILDKIEENIQNHFGGNNPHISPTIDFKYSVWVYDPPFNGHWETHHIYIPLGSIEINVTPFINIVRNAINALNFYHNALNDACFKLGNALAKELELAAKQLDHDNNKAKYDRLNKINSEHNNNPKEIAILSPVSLMNYTKAIDVKIHLGGVPMSYLGLGKDEQQRVLIYINGELIPPKSLIIDSSNLESKNDKNHIKDFDYQNLITVNDIGNVSNAFNSTIGTIKTSKSIIITDTSLHYPEQLLKGKEVSSGKQFAFSASKFIEQPISKSVYKAPTNNYTSANLFVEKNTKVINKKEGITKGNLLVHNYDVKGNLPGRGISPSKINNLLKDRIPGMLIQFKVELDKPFIEKGVNVITVVVIERGGNRHQQNVSFTISDEPILKKPMPGVINVFNPKANKIEIATITLSNLIDHFKNNDKKNGGSMDDYLSTVKKEEIKMIKPVKPESLRIDKPLAHAMKKKETIVVMQKNETGGEKQVDKPIYLEYFSTNERKDILIKNLLDRKLIDKKTNENGKYNKYLSEQKMRLITEDVSYQKSLSVFDNDNNKIDGVIQVSKFIKKETFEVLNEKGKPTGTMKVVAYSSDAERIKELTKLKIESKLLKSKSIISEERISISDGDGKQLKTYFKSNIPLEFKASEIKNYKPNLQQQINLQKNVKGNLGGSVRNAIVLHVPKDNGMKYYDVKTNFLLSDKQERLKNRIEKAAEYLEKQNTFNLSKK